MKLLIITLLLPILVFAQTPQKPDTCFTQKELLEISNLIDSLSKTNDLNTQIIANYESLINEQETLIKLSDEQVAYKNNQINLFQDNITLYVNRAKLLQPKWYDKKGLWYGAGFLSALGAGILVNQLIK